MFWQDVFLASTRKDMKIGSPIKVEERRDLLWL
jgi:hypothetical protein